ncbi:hypothetical protein NQD34_008862 [Periophthalmus magnuspinnatus]|nr:hypothetical protein NQD34_008862 [Periophthalmus magnuspinnatus]
MEELDEAPVSPPCTKKKKMAEKEEKESRRIWEHVNIDEFQVPDSDYWHPASRFNLIEDEELMKRGCGALHYKSTEGVLAVKWYDNKCVTLLSNASGIKPLTSVQQWSKDAKANIAVQCPSLIAAYNQHMGGIDLSDMLVHLYKTPAKSRRWYFPLFGSPLTCAFPILGLSTRETVTY